MTFVRFTRRIGAPVLYERFATVLFCEVSEQIIPEDTPVGLLSSRHRQVSSVVVCLALLLARW